MFEGEIMSVNDEKRVSVRMSEETYDKIKHFAAREDVSVNQFMIDSCQHYINWILTDYDLPSAEIQRLNQIISVLNDLVQSSQSQNKSLRYFMDTFYSVTGSQSLLQQDADEK